MSKENRQTVNPVMGIQEWALIIFLSVIWGGSFFFVEVAVKTVTPLTIVLCRVGLAAIALWMFVLATGRQVPGSKAVWTGFFILGTVNNVLPFSLITWGQSQIDSSLAAIMNAFSPVFSVILAHFLTRDEKLTKSRLSGVVFGWCGVGVLIGGAGLKGDGPAVAGQSAVLGAAFLYACAAIFGRRFRDLDPVVVAAGMLTASSVIMLPLAFFLEDPLSLSLELPVLGALAGLALVSTALAYIIYFRVLARAGATNILLVTFLIPVSAIFLGVTVLGESLGPHALAGMAMILTGLAAIDGRIFKRGTR